MLKNWHTIKFGDTKRTPKEAWATCPKQLPCRLCRQSFVDAIFGDRCCKHPEHPRNKR